MLNRVKEATLPKKICSLMHRSMKQHLGSRSVPHNWHSKLIKTVLKGSFAVLDKRRVCVNLNIFLKVQRDVTCTLELGIK